MNSGTSETCGTGATDDCLNLAGGADEDPGNDKFCELSDLLSYASHLNPSARIIFNIFRNFCILYCNLRVNMLKYFLIILRKAV